MAATDPSPFAVTRRQAELITGIAMRDWTGPHMWIRAWHHDLTLIEAARRGVLPPSLATQLAQALGNEVTRWSDGARAAPLSRPDFSSGRSPRRA